MSERYTRLFALEENLYSEGSPIVISAGALLKDNRTGAVLAQLKIKNISRKVIKAAIVCLTAYDAFGKIIDGTVEKEYLDLAVERDAEFGQKVLIPLPDAASRAFTAAVTCDGFADNTVWNYAGEEQTALPHPKLFAETLGESELVKQYQIKYGVRAKVFPEAYKDVWFCACGALCRADEGLCHTCGNKRSELLSFDREALTAEKDKRLEKEAAARKKAEEKAEAARRKAEEERAAVERLKAEKKARRVKKAKRTAAIGIPTICVCVAFAMLLTQVIIPGYRKRAVKEALINANVGDTIVFGKYEQDNDFSNGKEAVEWIVLAKEENKLLVISKYALDCQLYDTEDAQVGWKKCSLRQWLNQSFFDATFSEEEKIAILVGDIPYSKTGSNKVTQDKVFLLSAIEVKTYLDTDSARECEATEYAVSSGVAVARNGKCWWLLRPSGEWIVELPSVGINGQIVGSSFYSGNSAVRPAMWIDLGT